MRGARPRRRRTRRPADGIGTTTSVTSSCAPRAVVNGPRSTSAMARSRTPSAERIETRAPSASRTAGMSDAGSACTMLPPIVPRLRICRSPIPRAHSGIASRPAGSSALASSLQVVSGPMCSAPSRSSMPRSSSREMSTTSDGRATRSFMTGMSDCPPAIAFASGSPSNSRAWSTSAARAYRVGAGITRILRLRGSTRRCPDSRCSDRGCRAARGESPRRSARRRARGDPRP